MMSIFKKRQNNVPEQHELNQKNYQSLLLALIVVIVPHLFFMPILLSILIAMVLVVWQFLVFKQGSFKVTQKQSIQYAVILLALGLIYLEFKTFIGVSAGCATLVVMLLGKAFEVKNYRDAIIQANFALFVLASLFLYGQEIYLAFFALLGMLACFYSMYQLQSYNSAYEEVITQDVSSRALRQHAFKTVAKILALAMPLMIVLFLFFPRLPPLWSIPQPSNQAKTGVSDEMTPGDIAQLSQSRDLAFRVVFDDFSQMPEKSQLYWRALVLEQFDGVRWKQHYQTKFSQPIEYVQDKKVYLPQIYNTPSAQLGTAQYKVMYEPTFQVWAYALEHSLGNGVAERRLGRLMLKPDLTLQFNRELTERRSTNLLLLKPKPSANLYLDDYSRQINTYFENEKLNPRSRTFAQEMWQKNPHPEQYAQAILNWIRKENFSYTLSPPLLQGDRVDDFLFRTRAGFCEHYASAYVNLMRMVGIPARVVTGYQGGQWAPDQQSWEVRQLDAHAWSEIWLEGKGWMRIDPTSAIAPERIEMGMQAYAETDEGLYGEQARGLWQLTGSKWLTQTRIWLDYANYQWQSKVVGFDRDNQKNWLQSLSIKDLSQQLVYLLVIFFVMIGLVLWWLSRQQKIKIPALDQSLAALSKRLQSVDLHRLPNEPVLTWFERVENHHLSDPKRLDEIKKLYIQHVYVSPLLGNDLNKLHKLLLKYTVEKKDK